MNILVLVPDLEAPSCRFRVLQYVKPLLAEGIRLRLLELNRDKIRRRRALESAADFDGVFLHRKLLNRFDYRILRRRARKLIYDFDDAVIFRDSNAARPNSRMRRKKFQRLVTGADLVIAGNEYLSELAGRWTRRPRIIPTVVDLTPFPAEPAPGPGTVIGWMGTKSNFIYLNRILPALRSLSRRNKDIKFKVVSDGVPDLPGIPLIVKRWSLQDEVLDLVSFDLGIMPLISDPWARGKCALKIIQYFAAFLPVVSSPVGSNLSLVKEGINGCFARSPGEWESKIEELLASRQKREEMGQAGRRLVEEEYSLSVMVPRMVEALRQAVK